MVVACAGVVPPSLVSIPFDKGSGGASMGEAVREWKNRVVGGMAECKEQLKEE
jgi:hypothetical protein